MFRLIILPTLLALSTMDFQRIKEDPRPKTEDQILEDTKTQ